MFPLIIAGCILISGLGLVFFLLWKESHRQNNSSIKENAKGNTQETDSTALLARLGLEENAAQGKPAPKKPRIHFFNLGKKSAPLKTDPELTAMSLADGSFLNIENTKGTATLRLDKSTKKEFAPETELALEVEDLRLKNKDITGKLEKIDSLLREKSEELEKTRKDLAAELRNRKEFNKIKDILEKELKDLKDRNRISQNEVTASQTETQSNLKRITQLEEKIKKLEKENREREEALKPGAAGIDQTLSVPSNIQEKLAQTEELLAEKEKKITALLEIMEKNSQQKILTAKEEGTQSPDTTTPFNNPLPSMENIQAANNQVPPPEGNKTNRVEPDISKLKPINPEYLKIIEETAAISIPTENLEDKSSNDRDHKAGRSDMTTKSLLQKIEEGIDRTQLDSAENMAKQIPAEEQKLLKEKNLTSTKIPDGMAHTSTDKPTDSPREPNTKV